MRTTHRNLADSKPYEGVVMLRRFLRDGEIFFKFNIPLLVFMLFLMYVQIEKSSTQMIRANFKYIIIGRELCIHRQRRSFSRSKINSAILGTFIPNLSLEIREYSGIKRHRIQNLQIEN